MRTAIAAALCLISGALPAAAQSAEPICNPRTFMPLSGPYGIIGTYELSNGDNLRVSREALHYYAEMGQTGRIEIVPLDDDEFAQRGGPVRFAFNRDVTGTDVEVTGLDQPRTANACPRESRGGMVR